MPQYVVATHCRRVVVYAAIRCSNPLSAFCLTGFKMDLIYYVSTRVFFFLIIYKMLKLPGSKLQEKIKQLENNLKDKQRGFKQLENILKDKQRGFEQISLLYERQSDQIEDLITELGACRQILLNKKNTPPLPAGQTRKRTKRTKRKSRKSSSKSKKRKSRKSSRRKSKRKVRRPGAQYRR